jgi:hypothetical protein
MSNNLRDKKLIIQNWFFSTASAICQGQQWRAGVVIRENLKKILPFGARMKSSCRAVFHGMLISDKK